jgi:hypothetical protein
MNSHPSGRRSALQKIAAGALAASGIAPFRAGAATAWPSQPVKLVVPFAAGGSTDALARLLARKLQDALGQPFVVENRGGANGNLGASVVATAPSDGYTLMLSTTGPLSINKLLYKSTPFNPITDFTPVSLLADVPLLLASSPTLPVKDMRQLLANLKANPGQVAYSTGGNGSMGHLSALLMQRATGTSMVHVPYKGSSGALNDLLAGVKVVVDHFGRPDEAHDGIRGEGFQRLLRSIEGGRTWVKLSSPFRLLSESLVREAGKALLENAGPERLMWGSDWPFAAFESSFSYDKALANLNELVPDPAMRRRISCDTPLKFYFA